MVGSGTTDSKRGAVVDGKKEYVVIPTLAPFHASTAPARLIVGPFGSGKSVAAVAEIAALNPRLSRNTRYLIIRKTYRMLMDSCVKTFFEWIPRDFGQWREADMVFTCPSPTGGVMEFLFRSADSAEDIEKFRGLEISGAWLDEGQELSQDVKLIVQGRLRYPLDHPYYTIIITTNPCPTDHWIYKTFVENPLPGHVYWQQKARENIYLPPKYYEDIEAAYRDRPELKRRYVDGEWGSVFSGKPVYGNEFHWDTHVAKSHLKPVDGVELYCGWDFGLNPACLFTQIHPNGQWMILRELYADDMGFDEFSDAVIEFSNRTFPGQTFIDVGDPAGRARAATAEKSCYDILRSKRRICRAAPTNDLIPRLEAVKRRLIRSAKGNPLLIIDPRCSRLIDGFSGGYKFKERGTTGTMQDSPEKDKFSHVHDALQYVALALFGYSERNDRLFRDPLPEQLGIVNA